MGFDKTCPVCGKRYTAKKASRVYCSVECLIDSYTTPALPKHIIADDSPCKIWRGDLENDKPVLVFEDTIVDLRSAQVDLPEGKRINLSCGNHYCVNEKHYEIVDDLSQFGFI